MIAHTYSLSEVSETQYARSGRVQTDWIQYFKKSVSKNEL